MTGVKKTVAGAGSGRETEIQSLQVPAILVLDQHADTQVLRLPLRREGDATAQAARQGQDRAGMAHHPFMLETPAGGQLLQPSEV